MLHSNMLLQYFCRRFGINHGDHRCHRASLSRTYESGLLQKLTLGSICAGEHGKYSSCLPSDDPYGSLTGNSIGKLFIGGIIRVFVGCHVYDIYRFDLYPHPERAPERIPFGKGLLIPSGSERRARIVAGNTANRRNHGSIYGGIALDRGGRGGSVISILLWVFYNKPLHGNCSLRE
jgi:hypothetical protein